MAKNLVIVESPAKAKTIEKFLGSDFEVRASMGHILDLPKSDLGVDVAHEFMPAYQEIDRKDKVIRELRSASKKASTVYLAPDPDREGEFIAWSLKKALNLQHPRRAVFHEITKRAVQDAVAHPREINEDLFNAQQARRVLDRLVGYQISPLLWRKVASGTSAGRVQSVAVRLICEREAEIRDFKTEEYWTIAATLSKLNEARTFVAMLAGRQGQAAAHGANGASEPDAEGDDVATEREKGKLRIGSEAEAKALLRELDGARWQVLKVDRRDTRRQPGLPYTTSTLQQDASTRLGFKPKRTMAIAQALYEGIELGDMGQQGLITYMRTDSTRISDEAQTAVKGYIAKAFSPQHVGAGRTAKAKASVQDAHEAIRPTDVTLTPDRIKSHLNDEQRKLYELIWRRFVASFMAPAIFDTVRVEIGAAKLLFRASGSTMKFDGFYAVWPHKEDAEMLPPLANGEPLTLRKLAPEQHFTQPPPRYNEASLIKELEERGIGRPSTYVPIVSTIQDRGYVEQQDRRFVPTWLGETVNDQLRKHFGDIVDVNFTARMERQLDAVEEGTQSWTKFLGEFYTGFSADLERATKEMVRVQRPVEEIGEACPQCGKPLLLRSGRFGKFISCSGFPECDYKRAIVVRTGVRCPVDGGDLVERRGKKKVFYGCANYPKCTFAVWDKPLTVPCPECEGLLTLPAKVQEALCIKCGALVTGFENDGTLQVVGHRPLDKISQPSQSAPRASKAAANGKATAKRTTTARRSAAKSTTTASKATTTRAAMNGKSATKRTTTASATTRKAASGTARKPTGAGSARTQAE